MEEKKKRKLLKRNSLLNYPISGEAGEADCFEHTVSGYKCNVKWYGFVACTFSICLAVVWLLGYAMPQANSDVSNLLLRITQCFSLQAASNSNSHRVFVACMSQTKECSSLCCMCHGLELFWIKQCWGNQIHGGYSNNLIRKTIKMLQVVVAKLEPVSYIQRQVV